MKPRREAHPAESSFPVPVRFRGVDLTAMDRAADRLGIRRTDLIRHATLAFVGLIDQAGGNKVAPMETPHHPNAETPASAN